MSKDHISLGKTGEEEALRFLKEQGYKIWKRNYKTKLGEIDIIAKDKDTVCFVEVKTRHSDKFGSPEESITQSKQKKIIRLALSFLKEMNLLDNKARFDVVSVAYAQGKPIPKLIKNAFELIGNFTF
ncbi:MAG: YraN family protein [Candidatus Omnitrophota bacterium]